MYVPTHSRPLVFTSEAGSGHDYTLFRSAAMIQHAVTVRWVSHLKAHVSQECLSGLSNVHKTISICVCTGNLCFDWHQKSFVLTALMECHN